MESIKQELEAILENIVISRKDDNSLPRLGREVKRMHNEQ